MSINIERKEDIILFLTRINKNFKLEIFTNIKKIIKILKKKIPFYIVKIILSFIEKNVCEELYELITGSISINEKYIDIFDKYNIHNETLNENIEFVCKFFKFKMNFLEFSEFIKISTFYDINLFFIKNTIDRFLKHKILCDCEKYTFKYNDKLFDEIILSLSFINDYFYLIVNKSFIKINKIKFVIVINHSTIDSSINYDLYIIYVPCFTEKKIEIYNTENIYKNINNNNTIINYDDKLFYLIDLDNFNN